MSSRPDPWDVYIVPDGIDEPSNTTDQSDIWTPRQTILQPSDGMPEWYHRYLDTDPAQISPEMSGGTPAPVSAGDVYTGISQKIAEPDPRLWRENPVLWAKERCAVELWSKQRKIIETLRDKPRVAVPSCHNTGKGLALDTPLPTPTGWTTMGDVQVGDELYDEAGEICRVIAKSPVRELDCYEVTLGTGERIICDGDHLWNLVPEKCRDRPSDWRLGWDRTRTYETRELVNVDRIQHWRLPLARAIKGESLNLPIPPYLFGAWLGDGASHGLSVGVADEDAEILDRCEWPSVRKTRYADNRKPFTWARYLPQNDERSGPRILKDLGVWKNKHIPDLYLRASYDDRLALLRGIMDTDGSAGEKQTAGISFCNRQLALDVCSLVASLGGKANFSHQVKRACGKMIDVWGTSVMTDFNPFSLTRKADRWNEDQCLWPSRRTATRIRKIERVRTVSTQCIVVDSPQNLFLVGRTMVPTHNSFLASVATAWWIDTHSVGDAFVVTTAPTGAQVKAILWRNINHFHAAHNLPGRVNLTEWYHGNEMVAMGRKPSEYDESAFQGIHALYVLVILDEACGVPEDLWVAAETIASNSNSRILAIGNPDDPHSHFAHVCEPDSGWDIVQIGAPDTPNFTGEEVNDRTRDSLISVPWAEGRKKDWGEHSPLYISKVLGKFPEDTDDGVIAGSWIANCRRMDGAFEATEPRVCGLDVGAGGDLTVLQERVGRRAARKWSKRTSEPMELVGEVVRRLVDWDIDRIVIDVIGVGWGVYGRLKELSSRYPGGDPGDMAHNAMVIPFNSAETANNSEKFANKRAELWWETGRENSRLGTWDLTAIDDETAAQLSSPKYRLNSKGKIIVESKDDLRKRIGRSTDDADALLMSFVDDSKVGHVFGSAVARARLSR